MISKQGFLGLALFIGGGIMVFALAKSEPTPVDNTEAEQATVTTEEIAHPVVQPLTADIETEERILAQKQRERENRVAELEKETEALLAAQEKARIEALQKASSEADSYKRAPAEAPSVQTRPEAIALAKEEEAKQELARQEAQKKANEQKLNEQKEREAQKAAEQKRNQQKEAEQKAAAQKEAAQKEAERKAAEQKAAAQKEAEQKAEVNKTGTHKVQTGDSLIRLSKQYNIPVSVLAEANNMGRNDALHLGKTIKIPTAREIKALERAAAERAAKEAAERANKERLQAADAKLATARQNARQQGENGKFVVQVALASNQANADQLASSLRAAGYKVSTSETNRGIRVVVGPERSREAANALRSKMVNDGRISATGAWVTEIQ